MSTLLSSIVTQIRNVLRDPAAQNLTEYTEAQLLFYLGEGFRDAQTELSLVDQGRRQAVAIGEPRGDLLLGLVVHEHQVVQVFPPGRLVAAMVLQADQPPLMHQGRDFHQVGDHQAGLLDQPAAGVVWLSHGLAS